MKYFTLHYDGMRAYFSPVRPGDILFRIVCVASKLNWKRISPGDEFSVHCDVPSATEFYIKHKTCIKAKAHPNSSSQTRSKHCSVRYSCGLTPKSLASCLHHETIFQFATQCPTGPVHQWMASFEVGSFAEPCWGCASEHYAIPSTKHYTWKRTWLVSRLSPTLWSFQNFQN